MADNIGVGAGDHRQRHRRETRGPARARIRMFAVEATLQAVPLINTLVAGIGDAVGRCRGGGGIRTHARIVQPNVGPLVPNAAGEFLPNIAVGIVAAA